MPVISLSKTYCECGRVKTERKINIRTFRQNFHKITESTLSIWAGKKKCWKCKKLPEIGEDWGISINFGEKNRIFCPDCSVYVLNEITKAWSDEKCQSDSGK